MRSASENVTPFTRPLGRKCVGRMVENRAGVSVCTPPQPLDIRAPPAQHDAMRDRRYLIAALICFALGIYLLTWMR